MFNWKRRLKNASKAALRKFFELGQRVGVDVLPRHFYSEIPYLHELKRSDHWKSPFSMIGVAGSELGSQVRLLEECCTPAIVEAIKTQAIYRHACTSNGEVGFGPIEADFLFAFVASKRPQQIVQIGCGVSTAVCLLAAEHAGYTPRIVCVEPYPTPYLTELARRGKIELLRQKAQEIDLAIIESLGTDLLFFVDSTHALGPAGEVSRIILEMLPRLKGGAWAHFHDIYFPYDYSRDFMATALFFQHESVLLHAFLACNARFRIAASLSMMHYGQPDTLAHALPHYRPAQNDRGLATSPGDFPSSIYLRVV